MSHPHISQGDHCKGMPVVQRFSLLDDSEGESPEPTNVLAVPERTH